MAVNARLLAHVLFLRAIWRQRDRWDAAWSASHRSHALARVRAGTYARSAFYRRHHADLLHAPLEALPPVTKSDLMEHFDEAVTVPGLQRTDLEAHLTALVGGDGEPGVPWRGRWWAAATAGTTGTLRVFVWDRTEWATVLASYARATTWAEVPAGLTRPLGMAVASSRVPTHQSAVMGASVQSPLVPTLRLDAASPLSEIVTALNAFQPRLLVGYPSVLGPLAAEQQAGRLMIAPQAVMAAAEVLSAAAAADIDAAWGSAPFDVYAATETAGDRLPVPVLHPPRLRGPGHRRTRRRAREPCAAGHRDPVAGDGAVRPDFAADPLRALGPSRSCGKGVPLRPVLPPARRCGRSPRGRPGTAHDIGSHPSPPQRLPPGPRRSVGGGWQVVQHPGRLQVQSVGLVPGHTTESVRERVAAALAEAGVVDTPVQVNVVANLDRTRLGKVRLVWALGQ